MGTGVAFASQMGTAQAVAFCDYDRDGDLDAFFGNTTAGLKARCAWSRNLSAKLSHYLDSPGVDRQPRRYHAEREPRLAHSVARFMTS